MEDKQKVYIRGCKGRGSEIKDILTGLGATETIDGCNNDDRVYFINHHNKITCAFIDSEVGAIIMDNYKEIELPQRRWEDGDVLIDEWNTESYAVFKEYGNKPFFRAYFVLLGKEILFDELLDAEHYRLASAKEIKGLPILFSYLMAYLNEAGLCLPKAVNKQKK